MIKRLAGSTPHIPLMVLASVMKNENRVQTAGYHTLKPLTDLIDVIPPESITARKFNHFIEYMLQSKEMFDQHKEVAKKILTDWRDNHEQLKGLLAQTSLPEGRNIDAAQHFSPQLSKMGQCGLQAVLRLEGLKVEGAVDGCNGFSCPTIAQSHLDICTGINQLVRQQSI